MTSAIAYYRVSTARQGKSGLGIEAQKAAVQRFAEAEGIDLIGQHIEVETGKGADALDRRPELGRALARARKAKCPVIVAKLDRLSRDVHFISGLMAQRVPFIVAELGAGEGARGEPRRSRSVCGQCSADRAGDPRFRAHDPSRDRRRAQCPRSSHGARWSMAFQHSFRLCAPQRPAGSNGSSP